MCLLSCNNDKNLIVNEQKVMPDDSEIVVNQKVFNEMIDKIGSSKNTWCNIR